MIQTTLQRLKDGVKAMQTNSRLLMVGILVFVFPLLFVWVNEGFFETAHTNVTTAEKRNISLFHDVIEANLRSNPEVLQDFISEIIESNDSINDVRIVQKIDRDLRIRYAIEGLVGQNEDSTELYVTAAVTPGQSFIFEFSPNGDRVWQVFRYVEIEDEEFYIFSEHSFAVTDSVINARRQQSYVGLTLIFFFIIALAYWLARQVNWQNNYKQLHSVLKEQELFTSVIAHELRAPLTAIRGYASFIEEGADTSSKNKQYAITIKKSAERVLLTVNDFLEVARIHAGQLKLKLEPVNLCTVIDNVISELESSAKEKGLSLRKDINKSSLVITTDKKYLFQALINLVSNAIKYTESGSITLHVKQTRTKTVLRVEDTGTGISAEDQQRLFMPFVRVGESDSLQATGSGLGLWITKKILEELGADVGVESIKNVGTHVVVTFHQ